MGSPDHSVVLLENLVHLDLFLERLFLGEVAYIEEIFVESLILLVRQPILPVLLHVYLETTII